MTNAEIRRWARKSVKDHILFLLLAMVVAELPSVAAIVICNLLHLPGPLPFLVALVGTYLSTVLQIGVIFLVVELVRTGKEGNLNAIGNGFRPPYRAAALAVALVNTLLQMVQSFARSGLILKSFWQNILLLACSVANIFTFLLPYLVVLLPDWEPGDILRNGLSVAKDRFWDIVVFRLVVALPVLAAVVVMGVGIVQARIEFGFLPLIVGAAGLVALLVMMAYITLAQGQYALELCRREKLVPEEE